jgi:RimJ/RimL family protein N-acetyltransferase
MAEQRVFLAELRQKDLPFLFELWHTPAVMRHADEFPRLRGWSKSEEPSTAWARYQQKRAALGKGYTQLVLRLPNRELLGESFFVPLPQGYTFGKWEKPDDTLCLMGDIKLKPEHWGQGLGTEGMQRVVAWLFSNTPCSWLVVPPIERIQPPNESMRKQDLCCMLECDPGGTTKSWN